MANRRRRASRLPSIRWRCGNRGLALSVRAEAYLAKHVSCLHCGGTLKRLPPNARERDLECTSCGAGFQVKVLQHGSSELLPGADFFTTKLAVAARLNSTLLILTYRDDGEVVDAWATPSACVPLSSVRPMGRRLGPHTKRAGTLNAYVDLSEIPSSARVYLIRDGWFVPLDEVRGAWTRAISEESVSDSGWVTDLAGEIYRRTGRYPCPEPPFLRRGLPFRVNELYVLEDALARKHPRNSSIRRAIPKALAELCRMRVLERVGNGTYRLLPTRKQARDEAV